MSAKLKEDVQYSLRALEGEVKVYEKQADLLFTLLNNLVGSNPNEFDRCPQTEELSRMALINKASALLSDQMVLILNDILVTLFLQEDTCKTIVKHTGKLESIIPGSVVYNLGLFVSQFRDQMKLNSAILNSIICDTRTDNTIVYLSTILHQPLVEYSNLEYIVSTIKASF